MSEEKPSVNPDVLKLGQSLPAWAWLLIIVLGSTGGGISSSVFRVDKWGASDDARQDAQLKRDVESSVLEALYIAIDNQPPGPVRERILALERAVADCGEGSYEPPTRLWNNVTRTQIREWWRGVHRN